MTETLSARVETPPCPESKDDEKTNEPEEISRRDIQYTEDLDHGELIGTKIKIGAQLYEIVCDDHIWGEDAEVIGGKNHGELEIEGTCTVCGETMYTTVLGENARIID